MPSSRPDTAPARSAAAVMPAARRRRAAAVVLWTAAVLGVLLLLALLPRPAAAEVAAASFAESEYAVFGRKAAASWRSSQPGGEIGGVRAEAPPPGQFGRKLKSGLLSLLLPGAGQFANGDNTKAYVFAGLEAAIWASYIGFHLSANEREDQFQQYAGIYAGAGGEHNESYWRAVAGYLDSDAYNEAELREARAEGDLGGADLIAPEDAWQWRTEEHLEHYRNLRADASRAQDRRDFMFLFAIVNRVAAVYDAVRDAVDDRLSTRVLGFDVTLDVDPSLGNPRPKCTFKRNF